jgi:molecular chaperone DnaK
VPAAPPAPQAAWSQTQPLTRPPERPAPVLVDVTPLTLAVETVGGYCDAIIERNTPVPCERTREFATVSDNQTHVRVRVSQGESSRFADNTLLGELELTGLRPAPRGQVQITVTFALDENGMLNVSARDSSTGRATQAQIRLIGLPGHEDVASLAARHAGHRF